jgi:hypothetical protein
MFTTSWPARKRRTAVLALVTAGLLCSGVGAARAETVGDVAGRYTILRADDKETGCMLTLDMRSGRAGGAKAQLAPACRDNGVVIFDPIAWSMERGRLTLTARKGHKAYFDKSGDGLWRRDSKEGKALSLKRL